MTDAGAVVKGIMMTTFTTMFLYCLWYAAWFWSFPSVCFHVSEPPHWDQSSAACLTLCQTPTLTCVMLLPWCCSGLVVTAVGSQLQGLDVLHYVSCSLWVCVVVNVGVYVSICLSCRVCHSLLQQRQNVSSKIQFTKLALKIDGYFWPSQRKVQSFCFTQRGWHA